MRPFTRRIDPETARFLVSTCRAVAVVAAVFSVAVATLLIANAVQLAVVEPLDNPALIAAREQYRAAPDNDELAQQVRALDLMARRAYFTRRWQIRTGAYLLLAGLALLAVCLRAVTALQQRLPQPKQGEPTFRWAPRSMRWGFLGAGVLLTAGALTAAFIGARTLGPEGSPAPRQGLLLTRAGKPSQGNAGVTESAAAAAGAGNDARPAAGARNGDYGTAAGGARERQGAGAAGDAASTSAGAAADGSPESDPELTRTEAFRRNWPQFRGPGGNAVAAAQDPPVQWDGEAGTNILWKAEIPLPGFGSPVIWDNKVFLSGADRSAQEIYCWDAETGELQWRRVVSDVPGSPAQPPRVSADTGYAAPTMAVNGSTAFAVFATGDLAAVDHGGNLRWTRNLGLPEHIYGYASSPALYGGSVIVQFDQEQGGRLMALDAASGAIRWQTPRRVQPSWASPVVVDTGSRPLLLVNGTPILAAYDPDNGRLLWQYEGMLGEVAPSPAYADGRVFAGNQLLNLVAVDSATGEKLWETYDDLPDVASPLATGELLIMAASYGVVTCLEAATGDLVWNQEFDTGFYASPVLAGGRVYLLDRAGVMRILSAGREPALIGSPSLGEATDATPAFRGGRIYVRGKRHLFCIGASDD